MPSNSVCNHTRNWQIGLPLRGRPILLITRMISNGNWTEWSTIQGVIGRFEFTSTITSELYDTKSNYQLIVSITECENVQYTWTSSFSPVIKTSRIYFIRVTSSGETTIKEPSSVQMIDARAAKLSDYSYPITKSSNWTAVIGYPRDRATTT